MTKVGQDNYLRKSIPPKNDNDNDKSRPRQLSRTNLCPMRTILQSRHLPNLVKASGGPDESPEGHQLMTSVSVPVYKKKDHKVGFPQFFLSLSRFALFQSNWTNQFGSRYGGRMARCCESL